MSYFIVISGKAASSLTVDEGYLTPIYEAQPYIKELASTISKSDGEPSYLWEDGESGTSHQIVCNSEECVFESESPEISALGKVLALCETHGLTLRLWWASNNPTSVIEVAHAKTASEAYSIITQQAGKGCGIGLVLSANRSFKADGVTPRP